MLTNSLKKIGALLRGGLSEFNEPEKRLLEVTMNALPKEEAAIFAKQIEAVSLIQHQHPGRLVSAYYSKGINVPQLPFFGYEYCVSKVIYRVNGKNRTASLVLHEGRFMTFEGSVPLKGDKVESIVKVVLHPAGYKPVAEEIDAGEHDKNA
ncbi:hypothetical protein [Teredinibacter franksiae]|uniref:hypothetical protein n=1 Tax=Teredinibacter franksiae TaxID=2761453 RepID=UPI001623822F|nr:hypothetical protein [Teredinibacter franksiae]